MVLFLIASAWMLGLIFYWQHYLVHKEKRIRQHEELNIQTVNHDMKSPVGIAGTYLVWVTGRISGLILRNSKKFPVAGSHRTFEILKKMSVKLVNERGLVLNYEVFELMVLVTGSMEKYRRRDSGSEAVRFSVLCRLKEIR